MVEAYPRGMRHRGASAELIGRQGELAVLEGRLAEAERGDSGFVLLRGEAGVGKSRLLDTFAQQAAERARVLVGGCVDVGEGGLPFAPVVEVFRRLARDLDAQRTSEVLGGNRFELARLVPQLSSERVTPSERMASGSQSTLFSAVLDAFENLADGHPLVVGVEDLHWADQSTVALLTHLASNLHGARTLIVATLRTDELHRRHPLRPLLSELARAPTVTRVDLARLGRDEVAAQIAGITGVEPDPTLVDDIAARSDGNPFFVEELLAEHEARGVGVPGTLRDVLLSPLTSLPEDTRRLVELVAVLGRPASHRLLETATGWHGRQLSERLRPAVEHHLLVEDRDGRCTFRHALTQEAVSEELLASERAALHRTVAETLSAHRQLAASENVDAELAHHWDAAHMPAATVRSSLAAAERATHMGAYAVALEHYERALELWHHHDAGEPTTPTRREVRWFAAEAAHRAGDGRREIGHLRAALAASDEIAAEDEAVLRQRLARAVGRTGEGDGGMREIEYARRLVLDRPDSRERAFVLASYARTRLRLHGPDDAVEPANEALQAARAADAGIAEASALRTLADALCSQGRYDEGIEHHERAVAIAEAEGDVDSLTMAYNGLLLALVTTQRHDRAQTLMERAQAWLDAGADRDAITAHLVTKIAWRLLAEGEWQRGDRLLDHVARRPLSGVHSIALHETRALLRLCQGRLDDAAADLAAARELGARGNRQLSRPWFVLEAVHAALEGRCDAAAEASDAALACEPVWEIDAHPLVYRVRVEVDATRSAPTSQRDAHLQGARDALTRLEQLEACGARRRIHQWGLARDASRARAELSRAENPHPGRWQALCDSEPHAAWRLYDRWRLAEALLATGRRDDAATELARGHAEARHLGAEQLRGELEDLARRGGVALPGVEPGAAELLELTPRERDVLRLVAQGRTNQEIAEELYIATKTASVHVSNILTKLGVTNRVQAAAVAHRHGFGDPEPASPAARPRP